MVWVANHLSDRGIGLKADNWISTGLICDLLQPDQGATIVAEFGSIGKLTLKLSAQYTTAIGQIQLQNLDV